MTQTIRAPTPCLILTPAPHGSGGAKVQGTSSQYVCGCERRPDFDKKQANLLLVISIRRAAIGLQA